MVDGNEHKSEDFGQQEETIDERRRRVLGASAGLIGIGGFGVERAGAQGEEGLATLADLAATQQTAGDNWPQYQFDTANTGYSSSVSGPTSVGTKWSPFETGGSFSAHHSPVVVDSVVYVGSEDHNVYAVDATDGSQIWASDVGSPGRGVAVANGTVYAGTRGVDALYALDASDGSQIWKYTDPKGNGHVNRSPTVVDGVIYAGGLDDYIFAVDAADGSELWRVFTSECFGGQVQTPAVVDGTVYIHEDCGRAWAFNAADGSEKWRFSDGSEKGQGSAPTVANGTVYFGTTRAPGGNQVHGVFAVDAETGNEQWRAIPSTGVGASPAYKDCSVEKGTA